ncbi:MAG: hypothetical protein IJA67_07960 [Oscillospiraceae bacterium]|nr:hypothetical protein [Oscillospiraceae bacterium]
MSMNLEDRLLQCENNNTITNDKELIEAIESLLEKEQSLPAEERDYDFIDEAVSTLISLNAAGLSEEDADAISERAMKRCLNRISENEAKKKERSNTKGSRLRLRWLIPAAAIMTMFAITVTAYAMGFDLLSMSKQAFDNLLEKTLYKNGNYELILTSDFDEYASIQEYLESNPDAVLLLPNEIGKDGSIRLYNFGVYIEIDIDFGSQKEDPSMNIRLSVDESLENLESEMVNGIPVHFTKYNGVYQGEFLYEGNYYSVRAASQDELKTVISNLKIHQQ